MHQNCGKNTHECFQINHIWGKMAKTIPVVFPGRRRTTDGSSGRDCLLQSGKYLLRDTGARQINGIIWRCNEVTWRRCDNVTRHSCHAEPEFLALCPPSSHLPCSLWWCGTCDLRSDRMLLKYKSYFTKVVPHWLIYRKLFTHNTRKMTLS